MLFLWCTAGDDLRETLEEYCAGTDRGALLSQWDPLANAPLTPRDVTCGSKKKVWWVCGRGHRWKAMVKSRVSGSGCPVCSNRVAGGENHLAATHPALAKQWHPTKNGALLPTDVTPGSVRSVWWRCENGHQWRAQVYSRTSNGAGCPYCTGKLVIPGENDLETRFPDVAAQWHPERNGEQTPRALHPYSNQKVWWRCSLGHDYQAAISARTMRGSGCPYCANRKVLPGFNDLATRQPRVAAQWHPTLNAPLTPEMVTVGSRRRVWWECPNGHVWKAVIYSRAGTRSSGCPVCAGVRVKVYFDPQGFE